LIDSSPVPMIIDQRDEVRRSVYRIILKVTFPQHCFTEDVLMLMLDRDSFSCITHLKNN